MVVVVRVSGDGTDGVFGAEAGGRKAKGMEGLSLCLRGSWALW